MTTANQDADKSKFKGLSIGLYYLGKYLAKVYDLYQSFKYSGKQRYMSDLDYQIKINFSLEREFDPALQKAMIDRLDLIAAHTTEPKITDQESSILESSFSNLTVIQFENEKLAQRANKAQGDKFLSKSENSICIKLAKKK